MRVDRRIHAHPNIRPSEPINAPSLSLVGDQDLAIFFHEDTHRDGPGLRQLKFEVFGVQRRGPPCAPAGAPASLSDVGAAGARFKGAREEDTCARIQSK
jgi:hypothetical protein